MTHKNEPSRSPAVAVSWPVESLPCTLVLVLTPSSQEPEPCVTITEHCKFCKWISGHSGSVSTVSLSHFLDACTSPATVVVGVGWMCMSHPGWRCKSLGVSYLSCFIPTEKLILKISGRCYGRQWYSLCQNKTAISLLHSSASQSTATFASSKSVLQTPGYSQQNKTRQGTLA